ncbi:uncharacterized protein LOC110026692 [Phalaenopsis equestris]|uniref:uncharacterized protein LOC110026692 n=1 Tax=Phalaenopsis equestris TaxID=78828 RepID=UPI0009E5622F|nr:uncharacterized protein LOC110026692 [Phalaenopsis equestris]
MGIFTKGFTFAVGIGFGIFIAQNYDVPNMKKLLSEWSSKAKHVEESYRKPKKDDK